MPCKQCAHLSKVQEFPYPTQLEGALAIVRTNVADGTLTEMDYASSETLRVDQPAFAELSSVPWPDVFEYYFRCVTCGALYRFSAETYHGRGGQWSPLPIAT